MQCEIFYDSVSDTGLDKGMGALPNNKIAYSMSSVHFTYCLSDIYNHHKLQLILPQVTKYKTNSAWLVNLIELLTARVH